MFNTCINPTIFIDFSEKTFITFKAVRLLLIIICDIVSPILDNNQTRWTVRKIFQILKLGLRLRYVPWLGKRKYVFKEWFNNTAEIFLVDFFVKSCHSTLIKHFVHCNFVYYNEGTVLKNIAMKAYFLSRKEHMR